MNTLVTSLSHDQPSHRTSLYPKFNEVYKTYFVKDYPARTFVGSGSGPLGRGVHFEINGIAVKR